MTLHIDISLGMTLHIDSRLNMTSRAQEPRLGGNSAKASSGINAVTPSTGDDVQQHLKDTLASGGGYSQEPLVATLVVGRYLRAQYPNQYPNCWTPMLATLSFDRVLLNIARIQ
jgi:FAD binding domain